MCKRNMIRNKLLEINPIGSSASAAYNLLITSCFYHCQSITLFPLTDNNMVSEGAKKCYLKISKQIHFTVEMHHWMLTIRL